MERVPILMAVIKIAIYILAILPDIMGNEARSRLLIERMVSIEMMVPSVVIVLIDYPLFAIAKNTVTGSSTPVWAQKKKIRSPFTEAPRLQIHV